MAEKIVFTCSLGTAEIGDGLFYLRANRARDFAALQIAFIQDYARLQAENERLREERGNQQNEVASVLMLMDGLAEQWGDEGVFRRCRDRLRALVPTETGL